MCVWSAPARLAQTSVLRSTLSWTRTQNAGAGIGWGANAALGVRGPAGKATCGRALGGVAVKHPVRPPGLCWLRALAGLGALCDLWGQFSPALHKPVPAILSFNLCKS